MNVESYTILYAAEIVKTVIVKTVEEKVSALAAATKKRKMMLGNADPASNPKMPKLEAPVSKAAENSTESKMEAVIEGVIDDFKQKPPILPPQQSKNVSLDPNPVTADDNPRNVEGQRRARATAYTLWSKWQKERKSGNSLLSEWKALPKAEKELWQKEAKRVNNMNGLTQVPTSLNAYLLWQNQQRTKVAQENPGESYQDITKRLGAQWKALSDSDKKPYMEAAKMSAEGESKEMNRSKSFKEEPVRKESSEANPKGNFQLNLVRKPLPPTTTPAITSTSGHGPSKQYRAGGAQKTAQKNPLEMDRNSGADLSLPTSSLPKLVFRRNKSPNKTWDISALNYKADIQQGSAQNGSRQVKDAEIPHKDRDDNPKASTSG